VGQNTGNNVKEGKKVLEMGVGKGNLRFNQEIEGRKAKVIKDGGSRGLVVRGNYEGLKYVLVDREGKQSISLLSLREEGVI